jgi:uncharacterized protein (DUF3084 family)
MTGIKKLNTHFPTAIVSLLLVIFGIIAGGGMKWGIQNQIVERMKVDIEQIKQFDLKTVSSELERIMVDKNMVSSDIDQLGTNLVRIEQEQKGMKDILNKGMELRIQLQSDVKNMTIQLDRIEKMIQRHIEGGKQLSSIKSGPDYKP